MNNDLVERENESNSHPLIFTVLIVLFAFNDLFQYSGFASGIGWTFKFCLITLAVIMFFLLHYPYIENRPINLFLYVCGIGMIISMFFNYESSMQIVNVIPTLFIVYFTNLLSNITWTEKRMEYCAIGLLVYSVGMMYCFLPGNLFSGWNSNSPIMLMSSWLCGVALALMTEKKATIIFAAIVSILCINMMWQLENRSAIICAIIFLIVLAFRLYKRGVFAFRLFYGILLGINIGLPFFNSVLTNSNLYNSALSLSQNLFGKDTVYNGRDRLWSQAISRITEHPLFGTGGIRTIYNHNMSMDVLTALGVVGWIFIIVSFVLLLEKAFKPGAKSNIFLYCFALLFLMNTFENVMICNYVVVLFQYMLIAIPMSLNRGEEDGNDIHTDIQ